MPSDKTHRLQATPKVPVRYLADYMVASERSRRSILRNCKYPGIFRAIQHTEARNTITRFIINGGGDPAWLVEEESRLRSKICDTEFDRNLADHNADYIARFAHIWPRLDPLDYELRTGNRVQNYAAGGVTIPVDIAARTRRVTRTNKVRIGGIMLRYGKGETLNREVGWYQASFLFGFLREISSDEDIQPEAKMCLTLDAFGGQWHAAPSDAISRFRNMTAACASIAEMWPNITPPPNAVI